MSAPTGRIPYARVELLARWSDELNVPLKLCSRPSRRIGLRAGEQGIELSWPPGAAPDLIHGFLHSKRAWLRRQFQRIHDDHAAFAAALRWTPPEPGHLLVAGRLRLLDFSGPRGGCLHQGESLALGMDEHNAMRRILANHLLREFQQRIGELWRHFERAHGVRPRRIQLKPMRSLWGSCSFNAAMRLNTALLFGPAECTRAVLAHELAHLDHRDHSPRFWARVGELDPDYGFADADLLANRHLYMRLNGWLFAPASQAGRS